MSLISFSLSHDYLGDFFFRLSLSMTAFSQVAPIATFFFMLVLPLLFFFQVVLIDEFFASSNDFFSFDDFFFRWRPTLTFFPGRARRWLFPRWRMPLIFFPGRTSTSMTSFLGCAHCWFFHWSRPLLIFPQFTHVADLFFLVARFRRWLLFQIVPVDYFFFTGRASHSQVAPALVAVIFFQVLLIDDFFAGSHEFFADFLFRLRTSLTFPRSRPSLIFPQVTHVADFFSGSHEYVNDFLLRLRTTLIFSLVATVADFSPGNSRRWSLFPGRTIPLLTSFSDCTCQWLLFYRSRQSQIFFSCWICGCDFFSSCAYRWIFCQLARVLRWLLFQVAPVAVFVSHIAPVADFYFRLRTSLIFSTVAPVADFAPGYACRWFFSGSHE